MSPGERRTAYAFLVAEVASDLVALWREQKIEGLSRTERNKTLEEMRQHLTEAVDKYDAANMAWAAAIVPPPAV